MDEKDSLYFSKWNHFLKTILFKPNFSFSKRHFFVLEARTTFWPKNCFKIFLKVLVNSNICEMIIFRRGRRNRFFKCRWNWILNWLCDFLFLKIKFLFDSSSFWIKRNLWNVWLMLFILRMWFFWVLYFSIFRGQLLISLISVWFRRRFCVKYKFDCNSMTDMRPLVTKNWKNFIKAVLGVFHIIIHVWKQYCETLENE